MRQTIPRQPRAAMSRAARCRCVRRAGLLLRWVKRRIARIASRGSARSRHTTLVRRRRKGPFKTRIALGIVLFSGGLLSATYHADRPRSSVRTASTVVPPPPATKHTTTQPSRASSPDFALRTALESCFRLSAMPAAARPHAQCWRTAGKRFGIDPLLLVAIGTVETQLRSDTIHLNSDGSRDLGLMQINSVHLPRLEQNGVTATMLVENPCISIMTGAEILAQNVKRHGYNWNAVGAYNAGSRADRHALRMRYAVKVKREYRLLMQRESTTRNVSASRADIVVSLREDPARHAIHHPAG